MSRFVVRAVASDELYDTGDRYCTVSPRLADAYVHDQDECDTYLCEFGARWHAERRVKHATEQTGMEFEVYELK